jgi:hypothetical protein
MLCFASGARVAEGYIPSKTRTKLELNSVA